MSTPSEAAARRSRPPTGAALRALARSASSTASCPGCSSTAACSRRPRTSNHPLLEQLRFLSISANNLDEFFMVRVAGLRGQVRSGVDDALAGRPDAGRAARRGSRRAVSGARLRPAAALARAEGRAPARGHRARRRRRPHQGRDRGWLEDHFLHHIFPVLTPLAIDPAHPFPVHPQSRLLDRAAARRGRDGRSASSTRSSACRRRSSASSACPISPRRARRASSRSSR